MFPTVGRFFTNKGCSPVTFSTSSVPWAFVICRDASRQEVEANIAQLFSGFVLKNSEDWHKTGELVHLVAAKWRAEEGEEGPLLICPEDWPLICLTEWDLRPNPPGAPDNRRFFPPKSGTF